MQSTNYQSPMSGLETSELYHLAEQIVRESTREITETIAQLERIKDELTKKPLNHTSITSQTPKLRVVYSNG